MKLEINLTKRALRNLGLALMLIVLMLGMWFKPYFFYGNEAVLFTPEEGKLELLNGSWTNGIDEKKNGFVRITIAGKKDITVERRIDGTVYETKAQYKYSRADKLLTLTFFDENGETAAVEKCGFDPELIFGGTGEVALMQYMAAPFLFPDFKETLVEANPDYFINRVALLPLFSFAFALLGLVLCIFCRDSRWVSIYGAAYGIFAIVGYCLNDLLATGADRRLHIGICLVVLVYSAASFLIRTQEERA